MATQNNESQKASKNSRRKEFIWSDDEVELLLNVANDYKASKIAESIDWESMRSKYKDIFEIFVNSLPEEQYDPLNNFPHIKESIKLSNIASKLKAIRLKYRQAVDSGR